MRSIILAIFSLWVFSAAGFAQTEEAKPNDPYFAPFHPLKAPEPPRHFLKVRDRLAICGDSITEQRKYSRIIETYLTVCVPELDVTVRQYGWGGEKASGFLARMTNDCLRFKPTIETTCYGMNDHLYGLYTDAIGDAYRSNSTAIIESFKANHVRAVQGSPGCVGKVPLWHSTNNPATLDDLNVNLCHLRNIGIELAKKEKVNFADVFWPMLVAGHEAELKYGTNYHISGRDGVHPDWAGHVVMAYAFLRSFGLDGDIGTFTIDLRSKKAKASSGHEVKGFKDGGWTFTSHRYPFCIGDGDVSKDDNIHSGTTLVPFNQDLNRLMLVVKHATAKSYNVTWGTNTKSFTSDQLTKGVNLVNEFLVNPFSDNFARVDQAVGAKQAFETHEIKKVFHKDSKVPYSEEFLADPVATAAKAEKEREPLVNAVKAAFVPVTHTIKIEAE
jgi:hypothetical protein